MGISVLRTVILYVLLMVAMRIMGKRQIGELQPSEFIVTLLLSDLAAVPMQENDLPLLNGILPILILIALELIVSGTLLKFPKFGKAISGTPIPIIEDGVIDVKAMNKLRITVDDLAESLRQKDIFEIDNVQYAIAETNGTISAYCFSPYQTATKGDLNITEKGAMPLLVISDGTVLDWAVTLTGHNLQWIHDYLNKRHLHTNDVFLMTVNKLDKVYLLTYEDLKRGGKQSSDCG